ncbi:winged helix-turn-helix domain-containing protein [Streptomyces cyaneofuscatus]
MADALPEQITSGKLEPDAKLPTKAELREQYGSSRETVRKSLTQLVSERLVVSRVRRATSSATIGRWCSAPKRVPEAAVLAGNGRFHDRVRG